MITQILQRRHAGAGGRASAKYRAGLTAWRRQKRVRVIRHVTTALLVAMVPAMVILEVDHSSFFLGAAAATLAALRALVSDEPPAYVARWRTGAEAERRTARELRKLKRRGWRILHDVPWGRGNLDHLAVGPGGVHLLDTKDLGGEVTVEGAVLRVRRRLDPDDGYTIPNIAKLMRGRAIGVCELIQQLCGTRPYVNASVVIWSPFDQGLVEQQRVTFLAGDRVQAYLLAAPAKLTPDDVKRIGDALDAEFERRAQAA